MKHRESMVIADPKGEIYTNTIGYVPDDYDVYTAHIEPPYKIQI